MQALNPAATFNEVCGQRYFTRTYRKTDQHVTLQPTPTTLSRSFKSPNILFFYLSSLKKKQKNPRAPLADLHLHCLLVPPANTTLPFSRGTLDHSPLMSSTLLFISHSRRSLRLQPSPERFPATQQTALNAGRNTECPAAKPACGRTSGRTK